MLKGNNVMPSMVAVALDKYARELKSNGFKNIKCFECTYGSDGTITLEYNNTTLSIIYDEKIVPHRIKCIKFKPIINLFVKDYVLDLSDTATVGEFINAPENVDTNIKIILDYLETYFAKECVGVSYIIHDLKILITGRMFGLTGVEDNYRMIDKEQFVHNVLLLEKVLDMFNHFDKNDWNDLKIDNSTDSVYPTDNDDDEPTIYKYKDYTYKNAFTLSITYTGDLYKDDIDIEEVRLFPDIKNEKDYCIIIYMQLMFSFVDDEIRTSIINKLITLLKNENKFVYSVEEKLEKNLLSTIDEYYKNKKEE